MLMPMWIYITHTVIYPYRPCGHLFLLATIEALGICHAARRCGIQCMQMASFNVYIMFWMPHRRAA